MELPSQEPRQESPLHVLENEIENDLAHRFSGKVLLRSEIPLDENIFQQLLSTSHFTPAKSIKRNLFYAECQRCGNQKRSLLATIPCHTCHNTHLYCRKCIEMGRVMECEPLYEWTGPQVKWPTHEEPCSWTGELTDAQQTAAERITFAINNNEKELLTWAVCGAGKTEMLFPGISEALRRGKRICIATPRADVVRELLPRIRTAFSGVHVQGLYGGSKDNDGAAQLIIATTHQLLRFKGAFDVLIIDEVDAFPYHADASLPYATNRAKKPGLTTIYLTATPRQKQRQQISRNKLPHIFVPIRFHGHPLPVPTFKMCFSLQKDLRNLDPPSAFIKWAKHRKNPHRRVLIFVPTIALAEKMKENLAELLVRENVITSEKSVVAVHAADVDREEKVLHFRENKTTILVTTTILERGVTFPSVDVAIVDAGHDVFDEAALVQIAGRAGRSAIDPSGEVLFFHDGKTDAMVHAAQSIKMMNKRGGFH